MKVSTRATDKHGLGTAVLDEEGSYRYRLTREWAVSAPRVGWCMLNPSVADASISDQTLDRVIGFSRSWGYGSAEVVNLFAWRSRSPAELASVADPVGPDNDLSIREAACQADKFVFAWGNGGTLRNPVTGQPRCGEVMALLDDIGPSVMCLGLTNKNQPRHPLYLPADQPAMSWD